MIDTKRNLERSSCHKVGVISNISTTHELYVVVPGTTSWTVDPARVAVIIMVALESQPHSTIRYRASANERPLFRRKIPDREGSCMVIMGIDATPSGQIRLAVLPRLEARPPRTQQCQVFRYTRLKYIP